MNNFGAQMVSEGKGSSLKALKIKSLKGPWVVLVKEMNNSGWSPTEKDFLGPHRCHCRSASSINSEKRNKYGSMRKLSVLSHVTDMSKVRLILYD